MAGAMPVEAKEVVEITAPNPGCVDHCGCDIFCDQENKIGGCDFYLYGSCSLLVTYLKTSHGDVFHHKSTACVHVSV